MIFWKLYKKNRLGFTLVEVAITTALVTVFSVVTVMNISGFRNNLNLTLSAREIVSALRDMQKKSTVQEDGKQWGVVFQNGSSDAYKTFNGASSTTGIQKIYNLRKGIIFYSPTEGNQSEVIFQTMTGRPNTSFSVVLTRVDDLGTRVIVQMSANGKISFYAQESLGVTSLTPNFGAQNSNPTISQVSGRGFASGATVKLSKSGQSDIVGTGFSFVDSGMLTGGSFNLSGAVTGTWDVVVTNPTGEFSTLSNGFTVTGPAPEVTNISPSLGISGQTVSGIVVNGANFASGATVKLSKSGQSDIVGTGFSFVDSGTLTGGSFDLSGAAEGWWDIVVTNTDTQSGTFTSRFRVVSVASGIIDGTDHWAWNDNWGWIDFATSTGNVVVTDAELSGYAKNANAGWISLNCADENICSYGTQHSDTGYYYRVLNSSSTGKVYGYAWNDLMGWISFNCDQSGIGGPNTCGTSNYGVTIATSTGIFSGYAWSDVAGWISFNCLNTGTCATSNYRVLTTWRVVPEIVYESGGEGDSTTEGTCGDSSGWVDTEMCIDVPSDAPTGAQDVVVTSSSSDSNAEPFEVL